MSEGFPNLLAEHVWRARYRTRRKDGTAERSLDETLARVRARERRAREVRALVVDL
jgi:hypothetical protein